MHVSLHDSQTEQLRKATGQQIQGAPGRIRTCDARLRSPALYPLSYGGAQVRVSVRRGAAAHAAAPVSGERQLRFSAVSSMKKDVASEESSVPVHFSVIVCPAYEERLTLRWT
jgi:hypothetical protein